MSLISVCIPAYEMHGEGSKFLKRSFDVLKEQTFKDFEVVVSDNSEDDAIKNLCREYENILNINFVRNPKKRNGPKYKRGDKNSSRGNYKDTFFG